MREILRIQPKHRLPKIPALNKQCMLSSADLLSLKIFRQIRAWILQLCHANMKHCPEISACSVLRMSAPKLAIPFGRSGCRLTMKVSVSVQRVMHERKRYRSQTVFEAAMAARGSS